MIKDAVFLIQRNQDGNDAEPLIPRSPASPGVRVPGALRRGELLMKDHVRIRGEIAEYLNWPFILALFMVAANIAVALVDHAAGAAMGGFTLAEIVIAVWLWFGKRKHLMDGLVDFSARYSAAQVQLLDGMAVPYGIVDTDGRILWMNREFAGIIGTDRTRNPLSGYFPELTPNFFDRIKADTRIHSQYKDRFYEIDLRPVSMDQDAADSIGSENSAADERLTAVFLIDETQALIYEKEIDNQKMVAGLIYLDNYDEALESIETVRRSLLEALIDRKIMKSISAMNGVVRKLEKDKYFFVIEQRYTEILRKNRFSLLEDVKTVNIGNEMAVTLSIGIGMHGSTYMQNYEYARAAIDMALGRGGDQAVVKDGDEIRFYGGKSQQVEKTTRVKARVKAHALRELMDTKDKILIMGHHLGDIDCFGASVGIWRIATTFNKKARIVINGVNSSVTPMLYKFKNSSEYPKDMFVTGEEAAEWADGTTMLVVVDVNRPSITEAPELLTRVHTIVVLDHHRQSTEIIKNATLSYVEPFASSACEMVAEILQYIGDNIRIRPLEADAMYGGIMIDTQNFMNQTGVRTFEAAAFLRRSGADVVRVRKLFRDQPQDFRARAKAIENMEIYREHYAITECPAEGLESPSIVGAQAANEMLDIIGIKATFVITKVDNVVYISGRSIDEVNVQVILEKLGGGGHRTIAGAQLRDISAEEARQKIKETLDSMSEKGEI